MQELLPLGVDSDLRHLLKSADTIIGSNLRIESTVDVHGASTMLICGVVRCIHASEGVIVVSETGKITESVNAKMLILLGSIDPGPASRATVICEHVITGKGSRVSNTDMLYKNMVTHPKAIMKKVSLDQIEELPCVTLHP